jgi:hypothetical protein
LAVIKKPMIVSFTKLIKTKTMIKSSKLTVIFLINLFITSQVLGQEIINNGCELCIQEGKYYSPQSIIVINSVEYGKSGYFLYECSNGQWILHSNEETIDFKINGVEKTSDNIIVQAGSCEICLYANLAYSNGSKLCLPNKYQMKNLYSNECRNGRWILKNSSTPCDINND